MFEKSFPLFSVLLTVFTDIQTEKSHQNLVQGIEGFEKSTMKRTETSEKITLPNQQGRLSVSFFAINLF